MKMLPFTDVEQIAAHNVAIGSAVDIINFRLSLE